MKNTKRALLLSALAIVMSIAMLIGSTFAWFTDSASTAVNTIQSGTLKIDIASDEEGVESLNGKSLSFVNVDGSANILWEPNCTFNTEEFYIVNEGNLALKFKFDLTGVTGDAELLDVISFIAKYNDGTNDVDVLGYEVKLAPEEAFGPIVISGHMDKDAGNEYQGLKLEGLAINVVATQNTVESDSIDNNYDAEAKYPVIVENATELAAALANGDNVVLIDDITDVNANTTITVAAGKNATIDLNGHELTAVADKSGNQELFLVKGTMTVKNGTLELVAQNNQGWGAMATIFDVTAGGVLKLDGVKANVVGTDMNFFVHLNNWGSATLEMTNCDITTTYVAVRAFNSGNDMNTVTIKDSDFHGGRMFWVQSYTSEGKDDSTLTLDIYGNNNTSDNEKPVRFGYDNSVYYDINGNLIP